MSKATVIDNSKNPEMIMVHKDKLGNEWYSYTNILDISPSRGMSAARADRYVGLRISEGNFKALVDTAIDAINNPNPDFVTAISILHEFKHRTEFLCEENSILDLAAIYYFLKDEDPEFPSNHHNKKKIEIWAKDEVCRGFFLHMGLALTRKFSDTPEEDLLKFLRESKMIADRIFKFIPEP